MPRSSTSARELDGQPRQVEKRHEHDRVIRRIWRLFAHSEPGEGPSTCKQSNHDGCDVEDQRLRTDGMHACHACNTSRGEVAELHSAITGVDVQLDLSWAFENSDIERQLRLSDARSRRNVRQVELEGGPKAGEAVVVD